MAKRVDNDSTMEVSSSQLVPDAKSRPVPHRAPGQDKNDVSMWIGGVVGADAFAGTAKPKRRGGLLIAFVVLLLLVAGAFAYLLFIKKDSAPSPSAGPAPGTGSSVLAAPATPADAQPLVPATTPGAAPTDASVDAAADAGALEADAISGLPVKPAAAKPITKKPATKAATKKVVNKPTPKKTTHK